MNPTRRCKCIKDTTIEGMKIGSIYKFRDNAAQKEIWINETDTTYEPLFCTIEYFNEHFKEVK